LQAPGAATRNRFLPAGCRRHRARRYRTQLRLISNISLIRNSTRMPADSCVDNLLRHVICGDRDAEDVETAADNRQGSPTLTRELGHNSFLRRCTPQRGSPVVLPEFLFNSCEVRRAFRFKRGTLTALAAPTGRCLPDCGVARELADLSMEPMSAPDSPRVTAWRKTLPPARTLDPIFIGGSSGSATRNALVPGFCRKSSATQHHPCRASLCRNPSASLAPDDSSTLRYHPPYPHISLKACLPGARAASPLLDERERAPWDLASSGSPFFKHRRRAGLLLRATYPPLAGLAHWTLRPAFFP